jgi:hypothetical protein
MNDKKEQISKDEVYSRDTTPLEVLLECMKETGKVSVDIPPHILEKLRPLREDCDRLEKIREIIMSDLEKTTEKLKLAKAIYWDAIEDSHNEKLQEVEEESCGSVIKFDDGIIIFKSAKQLAREEAKEHHGNLGHILSSILRSQHRDQ